MQLDAELPDHVPALQVTQIDKDEAPELGDHVPALQLMQTEADAADKELDHVPALQGSTPVAPVARFAKYPALAAVHDASELDVDVYVPAPHMVQVETAR